jgi:hypothetical protein
MSKAVVDDVMKVLERERNTPLTPTPKRAAAAKQEK